MISLAGFRLAKQACPASLLVSIRPDGKCKAIPTHRLEDYEKDSGADHHPHVLLGGVEKRPNRTPYQRHERPQQNQGERLAPPAPGTWATVLQNQSGTAQQVCRRYG